MRGGRGAGYRRGRLLATPQQIAAAAALDALKDAPVPIERETCGVCQGVGRIANQEACRR